MNNIYFDLHANCNRVETLVISERHGIAKVVGTIVCVCGSMAFTFYKGPPLYSDSRNDHDENTSKREEWIKGSLLCIAASVLYSLWLTHQVLHFFFSMIFHE